ncbi:MAG TPA: hypothetical protein PKN95_00375 [Verrucomicrobiota bacterium]|nr:hypothetical protein [Verrucomicrobiota bacterium]HNT14463.1 hypothetical protein [Verrucomicrobiota bacterium]
MSKRRLKLCATALLALALLWVAFLLFERFRGQIALTHYKQELTAKGEKLSPQDFVANFAEADNGAPTIFATIKSLTKGVVLPDSHPPRMRVLESGRAIVGFREPDWVEKNPYRNGEPLEGIFTNHWSDLAADLQTNTPALNEIQAALMKPVLHNRLNLAEGHNLQFPHLVSVKSLTHWFGGASQLALHKGRTAEAAKHLSSEINALRLLAEDGVVISELVRMAVGAIAKTDTWEALQTDGWADADLAAIQSAWETQHFAASMAYNLAGERVYMEQTAQQLRDSNDETYKWMFGEYAAFFSDEDEPKWVTWFKQMPYGEELLEGLRKQIYCRVWRFAWAHQAELRLLKDMQTLIELTRALTNNTSFPAVEEDLNALMLKSRNKNFYDRLRFPPPDSIATLAFAVKRSLRVEADRALCITAIALKRYSLRHGNYPAKLDALVPEFLPAVPVDYMDGNPIKYRLNGDGSFTLYSVGEDGRMTVAT